MGPKPIQDVAWPKAKTTEVLSGPELVHDIPVRQPLSTDLVSDDDSKPGNGFVLESKNDEADKPRPVTQLPFVSKKDLVGSAASSSKPTTPKPVLASLVFVAALVCLAIGAYLKFFRTG